MSNLPVVSQDMSERELAVALGLAQEQRGLGLPSLRVNYDDMTDDGKTIPRGQWTISLPDHGQVFAKEVTFRILMSTFQYSHFDTDTMKQVSISVHVRSIFDEAPDSTGGMRCGKLPKKQYEHLSKAEKEYQDKIKAARVIFGLVSFTGVDVDGKDVTVMDVPCVFYARGTNFMPISDYLKELDKKHVLAARVNTKFTLKRERNGGTVYWVVQPTNDGLVALSASDFDLIAQFGSTINAENETIIEKWRKAQDKKGSPDMKAVAGKLASGPVEIDPSLNDDVPFGLEGTDGDLASDFVVKQ